MNAQRVPSRLIRVCVRSYVTGRKESEETLTFDGLWQTVGDKGNRGKPILTELSISGVRSTHPYIIQTPKPSLYSTDCTLQPLSSINVAIPLLREKYTHSTTSRRPALVFSALAGHKEVVKPKEKNMSYVTFFCIVSLIGKLRVQRSDKDPGLQNWHNLSSLCSLLRAQRSSVQ